MIGSAQQSDRNRQSCATPFTFQSRVLAFIFNRIRWRRMCESIGLAHHTTFAATRYVRGIYAVRTCASKRVRAERGRSLARNKHARRGA